MKKFYIQPNVHVIEMSQSDIIVTSPNGIYLNNSVPNTPVEDITEQDITSGEFSLGW